MVLQWLVISEVFKSERVANAAIESAGEAIGGLQCRSAAGGGVRKLPDELGGWIASIETSPEMAGFAFGILRGWADSESFARKEQGR